MRVGVITFPGSNCDEDCSFSLGQLEGVEVSRLWHKDTASLGELDLIVLPGGFSYGDYLRTGAMAAISPIMSAVKEYASRGGRVFGICNGFQILCESGLLPGALVKNQKLGFICKEVTIEVGDPSPWTAPLSTGTQLKLPIAHGEGRFVVDPTTYSEMKKHGQIAFRYLEDLNGSFEKIAGITNREKNVCGMMPHPERAADLKSRDGMKIWNALLRQVREKA